MAIGGDSSFPLDAANSDQAAAWDGKEGSRWADQAARYDAAIVPHHRRLLEAARIGAADRILDVGCGNGESTIDAAREASSGNAHGVDLSGPMIEVARRRVRSAGLTNVTFSQADAQVHPFAPESYDLVLSRYGAMFFADPAVAFTSIGRSLAPHGRLVMIAWRTMAENEWLLAVRGSLAAGRDLPMPPAGAPGTPFALADPDVARQRLRLGGFERIEVVPFDAGFRAGTDAADAFGFLRETGPVLGLLDDLDPTTSRQALARLRDMLVEHESSDGVVLGSASWVITAVRAG